jgi:hypothetical protein
MLGNILLCVETMTLAMYILSTKELLGRFPPLTVTAFCYIWAAGWMWAAGLIVDYDKALFKLVRVLCVSAVHRPPHMSPQLTDVLVSKSGRSAAGAAICLPEHSANEPCPVGL